MSYNTFKKDHQYITILSYLDATLKFKSWCGTLSTLLSPAMKNVNIYWPDKSIKFLFMQQILMRRVFFKMGVHLWKNAQYARMCKYIKHS